ncbi:MBL fold metallo-hydrolase [Desulforhopalus singaporensis]|uniref:7,8-dihydropterin-6-yl-methyl-4-(Beta-D-ribofuranosyl)aminobenzene 5'-phosphate synthase n=1 Tax=Desulforhopalus singaporensis TaxID=91360 RepID=A0A1H0UF44_9BACT|nr:MBL fold metallo-hydrolase [Desulforhopalus singaporensis]SDP64618.1 7,8-dihydropterin-6-yl-methyl-4-(beta-D-ribofuranosyl)aminobenzene 5'-phosphate synthase [Desulforhopalus singaporensis]
MTSTVSPRITILVDNRAAAGLTTEHGFSLWVEVGNRHILFDTGQKSGLLVENASLLGIDLAETDSIVLSHGHYDHSGGLSQILRLAPQAEIYLHPAAVAPRCSIVAGVPKSIKMPTISQMALNRVPMEKLHWLQREDHLGPGIGVTGPIPRLSSFEENGSSFFLDCVGLRPDPIDDDLALWMETTQGLIVIVGCAHAGLINTINYVSRLTGDRRIRAIIGGFHLQSAGPQRLRQTVAALQAYNPELIVPCHCTGEAAVAILQDTFGERVCPGMAGMICRIDHQSQLTISHRSAMTAA